MGELKIDNEWVDRLIRQYKCGKKKLLAYRNRIEQMDPKQQTASLQIELTTVGEMISDMAYAIDWMSSGRRPGYSRGIDRRNAYRQAVVLDTDLFPSLQESEPENTVRLSSEQRRIALDVIRMMSERERVCYLLHAAQGMSYAEIGEKLKISRRTVQQYVERAKSKAGVAIREFLTCS